LITAEATFSIPEMTGANAMRWYISELLVVEG